MSIRIRLRRGMEVPNTEILDVGEPLWDPTNYRIGMGIGGYEVLWYPSVDPITGNLVLTGGMGISSLNGEDNATIAFPSKNNIQLSTNGAAAIDIDSNQSTTFFGEVTFNKPININATVTYSAGIVTSQVLTSELIATSSNLIDIQVDGESVGVITPLGVTSNSQRDTYIALSSSLENQAGLLRNIYSSGIISTEQYTFSTAFSPLTKTSISNFSAQGIHSHSDSASLVGLAELSILINGYYLNLPHLDPVTQYPTYSSTFGNTTVSQPPPVPASVLALPTGFITGTGNPSNTLTGTQIAWMQNVYNNNPETCSIELVYVEAWFDTWTGDYNSIQNASSATDIGSVSSLLNESLYYSNSGYNNPLEDVLNPLVSILGVDSNGYPILGVLNWRTCSIPVATPSIENQFLTINGVEWYLKALPYNSSKAASGVIDSTNRFSVRRDLYSRYASIHGFLSEANKIDLYTLVNSNYAIFDCVDLEYLCTMVPGLDGVGAPIGPYDSDPYNTSANYIPLSNRGTSYYNNAYSLYTNNLSGFSLSKKSLNDPQLFIAKTAQSNVVGGYSFMIPLELVLRSPRQSWNPLSLPLANPPTGTGLSSGNPYIGYNPSSYNFTLPSAIFSSNLSTSTPADTVLSAWMNNGSGVTALCYGSGIRIFDYDGTRTRFPIAAEAALSTAQGRELGLFKQTLKTILTKIAQGNVTADDINSAW